MKVLMFCEQMSQRMGGEAQIPYYFFRKMLAFGIDVEVVTHDRVRDEIERVFPDPAVRARFHFIKDRAVQVWLCKLCRFLPQRVVELVIYQLVHFVTAWSARKLVGALVRTRAIDVVFEPVPISPKTLSFMYGVGAPVVIGPLCGGLAFPPAFRHYDPPMARAVVAFGRVLSGIGHRLFPGKRRAAALAVANDQAAKALPRGCRGKVYEVVESGVDLAQWSTEPLLPTGPGPVRFVFVGRLVDYKGPDLLVEAFARARRASATDMHLHIIGDGPLRPRIEATIAEQTVGADVTMHGWLSHAQVRQVMRGCHCMVLPSLRECGGAVMLEAMTMGMPSIVANWAGPGKYIDETCGIRVNPDSREALVQGVADAMVRIAESPELRQRLGEGAQRRVRGNYFDWDTKTLRMLEIMSEVSGAPLPAGLPSSANFHDTPAAVRDGATQAV